MNIYINGRGFPAEQADVAVQYAQRVLNTTHGPVSVRTLGGHDIRTANLNQVIDLVQHQTLHTLQGPRS